MRSLDPNSTCPVRNATTPAERMRLFRKRRKFRRRVAKVEVDPAEIDALIQRGYLDPSDRDDLEALGAAVSVLFGRLNDAVTAAVSSGCQ
jgi:hypothetical protein